MKIIKFNLPAMYGDHHVSEVRRILGEVSGVKKIYASSNFKIAEIQYDGRKTNEEYLKRLLDEHGYLDALPIQAEYSGEAQPGNGHRYFRRTKILETTKNVIGFEQNVPTTGRPLWPCPGMGTIDGERN